MAKQYLFEVIGGTHQEGLGGKIYNKGDYIKATRDLRKAFPNKFRLIEHDAIPKQLLKEVAAANAEEEEEYVEPVAIKGETELIGDFKQDEEDEVGIDAEVSADIDSDDSDEEEEEEVERPVKKKRRKVRN